MTWQIVILAHIVVSALMTTLARSLSLSNRKAFFVVGFVSYMTISFAGIVYSFIFGVPWHYLPSTQELIYILPAGIGIVTAWLLHYKIIGLLGASNAMITSMANYIGTAVLGLIILGEHLSPTFVVGGALILTSIWVALRIQPDEQHKVRVSRAKLVLIIVAMMSAYSVGMLFEKISLDNIGVWEYARFGWFMQFICAGVLFALMGRREITHISPSTIRRAALLGLTTSVAGGLYILALSTGTLSSTILAASGKIALTSVLAYVFLRERNALPLRLAALALTIVGLWLIL